MAARGTLKSFFEKSNKEKRPLPDSVNVETNMESGNRLSVERIYQKKTQLEHILLRPDTYVGSIDPVTQDMWVYDEEVGMVQRSVTFVPGLFKIFDEILVNAADNKQRCSKMNQIKVDIDPENNTIEIFNNGKGIPIVMHKVENMYVPSLIFGHLLTSSNFNDDEKKVTGGRNGYGAKLCNIFSTKFVVETACKESGKSFKQVWRNNMTVTEEAVVKPSEKDFTRIRFSPDLAKFKMASLDKDIVAIMSRRAYDIAGSTKGVNVYLNGSKLPVNGFKDFVDFHLKGREDESGEPLKMVHEVVNQRWEVAVTCSEKGFQQISFVNSIATTKGGKHVDHVVDQMVSKIIEMVKRKTGKSTLTTIKPHQVKNHIWVFINCLIENPAFDSQTKENMTLQAKNFGSTCSLSDKFLKQVLKSKIVESVMSWVAFKAKTAMDQTCSSRQMSKIKGVLKLVDANHAGTKNARNCTLILTEGDSAKTLAVTGLGVVGRDTYGVFPLKGKVLNVREASTKQVLENAEIKNIIKILGLQFKKKYNSAVDLNSLRYGRLMIMTDQDQDGSHIKGLLINFIHHYWPDLIKSSFLEEFITPIVKVKKGNQTLSFYSLPEYEEWKLQTTDWPKWTAKYYKGLGTSTAVEARDYFKDMQRHRIRFKYDSAADDNSVLLAFSKKMIEQRKEWLSNGMEERKRRRELGLPELYLYGKNTKEVTYQEFIHKELILFSMMDNERSIPSLVDGFKPGQRKVMFTCFKRNLKKELKVAQLAGSVAEHSAYHHGEASLMATIINLAQNFVGSNNLNLLMPIGQFGTRLQGGKDSASPRYIFTKLSPLARHIFNKTDDNILNFQREDNQRIEPEWYIPIIPMVLINGVDGIGTAWMTKILNYDVREVVENVRRMIGGEEPLPMLPSYKNFRGTMLNPKHQYYVTLGEISVLNNTTVEISELPVKVWTEAYKENVLEPMLHGTAKAKPVISNYCEYHTDVTVRFVVTMSEEALREAETKGLHKFFKLYLSFSHSSMVLFDKDGCLKKYESVEEILKEFYQVRLEYYVKRKAFLEGMLLAESIELTNQARFIMEKIDGILVLENKKRNAIIKELAERKYDPDPIRAWKLQNNQEAVLEEEGAAEAESDGQVAEKETKSEKKSETKSDYDYLMRLNMWNLSQEKKESLLEQRDLKIKELEDLRRRTPKVLWTEDLNNFLEELNRCEEKERAENLSLMNAMMKKAGGGKIAKTKMFVHSGTGRRILASNDDFKKPDKVTSVEGKRSRKKKIDGSTPDGGEVSEDEVKPLSERLGKKKTAAEPAKKKGLTQSKLSFGATKKSLAKKSAKMASDSESDADDIVLSDSDVLPRERGPKRTAATKVTNFIVDSDSEDAFVPPSDDNDGDDDDFAVPKTSKAKSLNSKSSKLNKPKSSKVSQQSNKAISVSESDSSSSLESPPQNVNTSESQSSLFDSLLGGNDEKNGPSSSRPAKTAMPSSRNKSSSSSESDIELINGKSSDSSFVDIPVKKKVVKAKTASGTAPKRAKSKATAPANIASDSEDKPKTKKAAVSRKTAPKKKRTYSSDSDDAASFGSVKRANVGAEVANEVPRARSARSRAPISYNFGDDSGDSDM